MAAPIPVPSFVSLPGRAGTPAAVIRFQQPVILTTPPNQRVRRQGGAEILLPLNLYPEHDRLLYDEAVRATAQQAVKAFDRMHPNAMLTPADFNHIARALGPCYSRQSRCKVWATFVDVPSQRRLKLTSAAYKQRDETATQAQTNAHTQATGLAQELGHDIADTSTQP